MKVAHIVSRANTQDLMLGYSLPAFSKGDPTSFLAGMARASGLIKKVGFPRTRFKHTLISVVCSVVS